MKIVMRNEDIIRFDTDKVDTTVKDGFLTVKKKDADDVLFFASIYQLAYMDMETE